MNFEQTKNLIGRILISAIFIYAIPGKIINFEQTVEVISNKNISPTLAPLLLFSAIVCLIFWFNTFHLRIQAKIRCISSAYIYSSNNFYFSFLSFSNKSCINECWANWRINTWTKQCKR